MERQPVNTNEQALATDTIERAAFERFVGQVEQAAKEYVNDETCSDCVRRADRACQVLSALLKEIDGCVKRVMALN